MDTPGSQVCCSPATAGPGDTLLCCTVVLDEVRICLQVYALEIEQYMKDFAQPVFEKAGVDHKVQPSKWLHAVALPATCFRWYPELCCTTA